MDKLSDNKDSKKDETDDVNEAYWSTSNVKKHIQEKGMFSDSDTIDKTNVQATFRRDPNVHEGILDIAYAPKRSEHAYSRSKQAADPDSILQESPENQIRRKGEDASKHQTIKKSSSLSSNISAEVSITSVTNFEPRSNSTNDKDERIQSLQKQIKKAEVALGVSKPKVEETIRRMITGQMYNLEPYKSKDEKLELLDRAIETHDGNAIIAVVIFLRRTLKEQIFYFELIKRQDAVDQYLSYLKAHFNARELEFMLEKLNKAEELAMLRYKQAASVADPKNRISRLEQCLRAHFEYNPSLDHNASLIRQQMSLLQRQRMVDVGDDMIEKQGKHVVFRVLPRTRPVTNLPIITTLFYCCIYHYEEAESVISSPLSIRKDHLLTEKQFVWTAVRARAKMKKWSDIERLFTTKSWLGGTKMRSVIGFEKVSAVVHHFEAPSSVLSKYLMLVDDIEKRLELAFKMNSHKAVIDSYASQRDRKSLEQYQSRLKVNSEEWFYCKDTLDSPTIKWKS